MLPVHTRLGSLQLTTQTDDITIYGRKYLDIKPTGKYGFDCKTGNMLASGLIHAAARDNDPNLLGEVVRAILSEPRYSGIEVGFFSTISDALIATYAPPPS